MCSKKKKKVLQSFSYVPLILENDRRRKDACKALDPEKEE